MAPKRLTYAGGVTERTGSARCNGLLHGRMSGLPSTSENTRDGTVLGERIGSGNVSTIGMESFWTPLEQAHKGAFDELSPKRLALYPWAVAGHRYNRDPGTLAQMRDGSVIFEITAQERFP